MPRSLTIDAIQKFVETDLTVWHRELKGLDAQDKALALLARISERMGELSEETARRFGLATPDHDRDAPDTLDTAAAAVIMNIHLLAEILGVDMFEAYGTHMRTIQAMIRARDG
jgi:NTP pyrophosphatase (non-canonical NTP hydrolase)